MAKPTLADSRWADLGSNNTAPSSGARDSGFLNGGLVPSSTFNHLLLRAYNWFQFLDSLFGTNGAITLPSNEHITLAGTGLLKHGDRTMVIPVAAAAMDYSAGDNYSKEAGFYVCSGTGDIVDFPIMLPVGARIRSIAVRMTAAGTNSKSVRLWRNPGTGNVAVTSAQTSTTSGDQTITISSIDHVVLADNAYCIAFTPSSDASDNLFWARVTYDQP